MRRFPATVTIITFFLIFTLTPVRGQISLERCQEKSRENFPTIKRLNLLDLSLNYSLSNISKSYLPQLNLSLGASYQSDVTAIPQALSQILSNISGESVTFPTIDKDQYQALIEIRQTVWDGGSTTAKKGIEKAATQVERERVEVELYTLKERVANIFFAIIALQEQTKSIELHSQLLSSSREELEALLKGGVVTSTALDLIEIEEIKLEQARVRVESDLESFYKMLAIITGDKEVVGQELEKPLYLLKSRDRVGTLYSPLGSNRPELSLFRAQSNYLEWQAKGVRSSTIPKMALFAQGGYGNPGLNMFNPGFTGYYILGAKISWNISSLYYNKNSLDKIKLNLRESELHRESFLLERDIENAQNQGEIRKLQSLLESDSKIVALQKRVVKAAQAKMANGTISLPELIKEINEYKSASLLKEMHEVELMMALYRAHYINND
ncbi:MAG: TolC family protein [Bacteroidales bacterium]